MTVIPKTVQCRIAGNYSLNLRSSSLSKLIAKGIQLNNAKTIVEINPPAQFVSKILSDKDKINFELKNNKGNVLKEEFEVFGLFEELGGEYILSDKKSIIFENVLKVEIRDKELVVAEVTFALQYSLEPKMFSQVIKAKRDISLELIANYGTNINILTKNVEEIVKEFDEIMFDYDQNVFYNESDRIKEKEEQRALDLKQKEEKQEENRAQNSGKKRKKNSERWGS